MIAMAMDQKLDGEVAALGDLAREELVELWIKSHNCLPPSGVRRELLILSAAWDFQAKRLGGHSAETRRLLRSAIDRVAMQSSNRGTRRRAPDNYSNASTTPKTKLAAAAPRTPERKRLSPGARLFREWNGKTYVVDVIESGFVFEGNIVKSLSAIAKQITGVQWSGPRFFGL